MQVIRRATHWIQLWTFLLLEDQREATVTECNHLMMVARDFFSRQLDRDILVEYQMDRLFLRMMFLWLIDIYYILILSML